MKRPVFVNYQVVILLVFLFSITGCEDDEGFGDDYQYLGDQVTDVDGNSYNTISIGDQIWMAENLKVTNYNDGELIPNISAGNDWSLDTLGAYCNYDNDAGSADDYGRLYNWYAVNTDKLCPTGWHVPSLDEWTELRDFLVSDSVYNRDSLSVALKSTFGWNDNGNGDDYYHFRALPAGGRLSYDGQFLDQGNNGYWWSSDDFVKNDSTVYAAYVLIDKYGSVDDSDNDVRAIAYSKALGSSVRCIKDK